MKLVTLFASLLFLRSLCYIFAAHSSSEEANFVKSFRPFRKSTFDPAAIIPIDSGSTSGQNAGRNPLDHRISHSSIGHSLISGPSIDGHDPYRLNESLKISDYSDNFHTYKHAMRNLVSNELSSNLRRFNASMTNLTSDQLVASSFKKKLGYKKLQVAPKSCRCQLQKMQRIVNGQTAEPNQIPWQVSLAERNQHFCGESIESASTSVTRIRLSVNKLLIIILFCRD